MNKFVSVCIGCPFVNDAETDCRQGLPCRLYEYTKKLERERDEARKIAQKLRDEVLVQDPDYAEILPLLKGDDFLLPWEEDE